MLCSRSRTLTWTCSRFTGGSLAAVLGEETDERVHGRVVGVVDDEAALLATLREPGAGQAGEMERKRRGRQPQLLADRARGESFRARLHEQPKNREPRFLRQC